MTPIRDGSLTEAIAAISRAFPAPVSDEDYWPLLVALHESFSEEALASVVAAVSGRDRFVVHNDHAAAVSSRPPAPSEIERVTAALRAVGLNLDSS